MLFAIVLAVGLTPEFLPMITTVTLEQGALRMAKQKVIVFIIRTVGNPLRSRPSLPLTITTLLIVAVGFVLPYTPLAGPLGFTPLLALYFLFLAGMIVSYLLLVELVKLRLMIRYE